MNDIEFQSSKMTMLKNFQKFNFDMNYILKNFHNIKFLGMVLII